MSKKKVYVIYSSDEIKIVDTWDECKALTNGVKGKSFKSFVKSDELEIALWLLEKIVKETEEKRIVMENLVKSLLNLNNNELQSVYDSLGNNTNKNDHEELKEYLNKIGEKNYIAYVDGSYKDETKEYSCGLCVVYNNKIVYEYSNKYNDKNGMRQINGELKSALFACNFAIKNNIKNLYIAYDYEGIEKFATLKWKPKSLDIDFYVNAMQKNMRVLNINFIKIPAHKNFTFNEKADELSKQVLGIKK